MKPINIVHRLVLFSVIILTCIFAVNLPARADVIDDIAWVLDELGSANPFQIYGITGPTVREAKGLINCIADGNDVLVCVNNAQDTQVGKKLTAEASSITGLEDLPSWFQDFLNVYIAFKEEDVPEIVRHLGEAVICLIAQFFTAGLDLCGLIEDIVELAKDVWNSAKAVGEFFKDLGGAAYEALKSAGCEVYSWFGGDCGGDTPPPPETLAYAKYFNPSVLDKSGLREIERVEPNAFDSLVSRLKGSALKELPGNAVEIAAVWFEDAVNKQWSSDIVSRVSIELSKKRNEYDSSQNITSVAQGIWNASKSDHKTSPDEIRHVCYGQFATFWGYAHVDRWIAKFANQANTLGLQTNEQWCNNSFWNGNKQEFAATFQNVMKADCPQGGQTRLCSSVAAYKACLLIMSDFGQQNTCGFSTAAAREAAEHVKNEFQKAGSKIPCEIKDAVQPNTFAEFACTRPVQQATCRSIYQLYDQSFYKLPGRLLNCALHEDPNYAKNRQNVKRVVNNLNGKYGCQPSCLGIDQYDPMLVQKVGEWPEGLKPELQSYSGFLMPPSEKPGFNVPPVAISKRPFDGFNTPTVDLKVGTPKMPQPIDVRSKLPKPEARFTPETAMTPGVKTTLPIEKRTAPTVTKDMKTSMTKSMKPAVKPGISSPQIGAKQTTPALPPGAGGIPPGTEMKTMSGTLPSQTGTGTTPSSGKTAPSVQKISPLTKEKLALAAKQDAMPSTVAELSDITALEKVTIGGKTTIWNSTVSLDSKKAQRSANGLCSFVVHYSLRNSGKGATGGFTSAWTNSTTPGTWANKWSAIAPGATASKSDTVNLKPGVNTLTLFLDDKNQIKESNEKNNQYRVIVNVTGTCNGATLTPPAGIQPRQPANSKIPAVQKKEMKPSR